MGSDWRTTACRGEQGIISAWGGVTPSTASSSEYRAHGATGPVHFGPQITNQGYDIACPSVQLGNLCLCFRNCKIGVLIILHPKGVRMSKWDLSRYFSHCLAHCRLLIQVMIVITTITTFMCRHYASEWAHSINLWPQFSQQWNGDHLQLVPL